MYSSSVDGSNLRKVSSGLSFNLGSVEFSELESPDGLTRCDLINGFLRAAGLLGPCGPRASHTNHQNGRSRSESEHIEDRTGSQRTPYLFCAAWTARIPSCCLIA